MSDLTDRCEQQAEMILCHGFKATHNLLLDCASEIKRLNCEVKMYADWFDANASVLAAHNIGGYHLVDGNPVGVICSKALEDGE